MFWVDILDLVRFLKLGPSAIPFGLVINRLHV